MQTAVGALAVDGAHRRARAPAGAAALVRAAMAIAGDARPERARPRRVRDGRGVGHRARAAGRRGPGRPAGVVEVPLPSSLSATAVARLRDDPDQFARELARPMPRQPSPAARFGTRFHAWVEARFGQQSLLDPDDLPGRGDLGIDDEDDLRELIALRVRAVRRPGAARRRAAVRAGAGRPGGARPHRRGVRRAGRRLAGRRLEDQPRQTADPLQLALYRLAWAELMGVPLDGCGGVPLRAHGRDRRAQRPARPEALEELLSGRPPGRPVRQCLAYLS